MILEFTSNNKTLAIIEVSLTVPSRGDHVTLYTRTSDDKVREKMTYIVVRRHFIYETDAPHKCMLEVYKL